MKLENSAHVYFKLNRVLASFGFHKHLDQYDSTPIGNPLTVSYTDVPGNELLIRCYETPAGRTTVKATFNSSRARAWQDLGTFFDEIERIVELWKNGADEPPQPRADKVRHPGRQTRRFKVKEILNDVKAGMDDAALMAKYDLNSKGILDVMNKLLWHGLLTPEELADRRSLAKTVYMPVFQCRACGEIRFAKLDECPKCKGKMVPTNEGVVE